MDFTYRLIFRRLLAVMQHIGLTIGGEKGGEIVSAVHAAGLHLVQI